MDKKNDTLYFFSIEKLPKNTIRRNYIKKFVIDNSPYKKGFQHQDSTMNDVVETTAPVSEVTI